jgi:hypothetical protein
LYRANQTNVNVNPLTAGVNVSFFDNSDTIHAALGTGNYELGTYWTSGSDGTVTALKFFKTSTNTGTSRTLRLWSLVGGTSTLLGSVISDIEVTNSWNTYDLDTPVDITAGITYVVSYSNIGGGFPRESYAGADQSHGISIVTGCFGSGGSFPATTWNLNCYADVVFAAVSAWTLVLRGISQSNTDLLDNATDANSGGTLIKRDGNGDFSANIITADLIGNATTATNFTGSILGEVTGTQTSTVLSNDAVISKLLTGFVSGAGTLSASDSILTAIQKLDGNIIANNWNVTSEATPNTVMFRDGSSNTNINSLFCNYINNGGLMDCSDVHATNQVNTQTLVAGYGNISDMDCGNVRSSGTVTAVGFGDIAGNKLNVSGDVTAGTAIHVGSSAGFEAPSSQGAWMSWNRDDGGGRSAFMNQQGDGNVGGFEWLNYNNSNVLTPSSPLMTLSNQGNLSTLGSMSTTSIINGGDLTLTPNPQASGGINCHHVDATTYVNCMNITATGQINGGLFGDILCSDLSSETNIDANEGIVSGMAIKGGSLAGGYHGPTSQGAWMSWNRDSGGGKTCYMNQQGGGAGGFEWVNYNDSNVLSPANPLLTLNTSGDVAPLRHVILNYNAHVGSVSYDMTTSYGPAAGDSQFQIIPSPFQALGSDSGGVINVNTYSSVAGDALIGRVTYNTPYARAPAVVITAASGNVCDNDISRNIWIDTTASYFSLYIRTIGLATNTTYRWTYVVVGN